MNDRLRQKHLEVFLDVRGGLMGPKEIKLLASKIF